MNSSKQTIGRICQDLGLPVGDPYTQDWELELPEEFKTYEFLNRYLSAYSNPSYGDDERQLLMELMLVTTDDLLTSNRALGHKAWTSLASLLQKNPQLHQHQIDYWMLAGEPLEDTFAITPFVRALSERFSQPML